MEEMGFPGRRTTGGEEGEEGGGDAAEAPVVGQAILAMHEIQIAISFSPSSPPPLLLSRLLIFPDHPIRQLD